MDARARIIVYGDEKVIEPLARFWRLGAGFDTQEKQDAFVRLIQEMRRSSGHEDVSSATVRDVLLENVQSVQRRTTAIQSDPTQKAPPAMQTNRNGRG